MNYLPLYIKTHNSLLSSMIKIDDLIEFAKKNNISSLTITDNNMFGVMDFYLKCTQNNIKPVVGLELKINDKIFVLYCKNYDGYKNLLKLSTLISENDINFDNIKRYSANLLCIIPYESIELYDNLSMIYKDIFKGYTNEVLDDTNAVYMKQILYLEKRDREYIKYLYAIRDKKLVSEITDTFDNHLKIVREDNNLLINSMCNLEIPFNNNLLPSYDCIDSYSYLKKLCKEGLIRIFKDKVKKIYLDRLKYELEVIHDMGFDNYFLIVWDYVKYAKENGILVSPGRGSAAGSLVSYLLNITTIDPIKYNLLFERFLNKERISMPDIDMDFDSNRREEVIRYCINKYGEKKVAPIITFSTLKAKQVIKDVSKVMNVSLKLSDILCDMLDRNLNLTDNYKNPKIKHYLEVHPELNEVYKVSLKLEDIKRQSSIHAAGVVMCKSDLEEVIPLLLHEDIYITGYDMEYLEKLGLLKMDFLGISFLTLISDIIKDINLTDKSVNFDNIEDDPKVYDIFKTSNTLGIFQFESDGMMNFLRKLKPNNFEDLVAAIALFRPGPMDNIDSYIRRKEGKDDINYIIPLLEPILKNTYGIIIYQEQIMQIASKVASYSLAEADLLRKAMSKKKEDILLKEKDKFINGCINNSITKEKAIELYELIFKFASYGFNRSHSVAYSMVAYKMAYLKYYYPQIFMKNLLTRFINSASKTKDYIYECKKNKVNILIPDINISTNNYEIEGNDIRYPLSNIKNVGNIATSNILKERSKGLFNSIFDFMRRCYSLGVNRKIVESLIYSGAFTSFNINKKTLIDNLDKLINYAELGDLLDEELRPVLNEVDEYSNNELMDQELEVFGFYLSNHPITSYKINEKSIDICDASKYFDKVIDIVLYVDRLKEVTTKKSDKMLFITATDEKDMIDIVLFPDIYIVDDIKKGDIIKINGRVEKRFDKYQIIVKKYTKLKE